MPCFHPMQAFRLEDGSVKFAARSGEGSDLTLPCGRCVGCQLDKSRQWAVRCFHEAKMHEHSIFVTLTYSDENLPDDWNLCYRDFQLFMMRLRKKKGKGIRFFMCGEYGEKNGRPHYHACLFGVWFDDYSVWRKSAAGHTLWRSKELESLWDLGHSEYGLVSLESAGYVARYAVKDTSRPGSEFIVDPDTGELIERTRPFGRMSLRPGIGGNYFEKYGKEIFPNDYCVVDGKKVPVPRYYAKLQDRKPGTVLDDVQFAREKRSQRLSADCTEARLRDREVVKKAQLKQLKRSI